MSDKTIKLQVRNSFCMELEYLMIKTDTLLYSYASMHCITVLS